MNSANVAELSKNVWYIHKYDVALRYGGPEEDGWWYDSGIPTGFTFGPLVCSEDDAYAQCRKLNELERARREREEQYDYTSVLSYLSTHYEYDVVQDSEPKAYPQERPHYE